MQPLDLHQEYSKIRTQGREISMETVTLESAEGNTAAKARTATFCDRLNHIIKMRPDVVRPGRSRTNDFASKFNIHYATANKLLNGKIDPSLALAWSIADAFDVSLNWLCGEGSRDVNEMRNESLVKILIFKTRSSEEQAFALVPAGELPRGFDSTNLVYAQTRTEKGDIENVIFKLITVPQEGKVHLIFDPKTKDTYLRRINVMPDRDELLCFTLETGAIETVKFSKAVFGQMSDAEKLCILGPVVARIKFGFKGD